LIVGQVHFNAPVDWLADDKRTFEAKKKDQLNLFQFSVINVLIKNKEEYQVRF